MKRIYLIVLFCLPQLLFAQGSQQMFWALNKCGRTLAKIGSGASAAYSLRQLNCTYSGPAIRVRRTGGGGGSTQDIGFLANGELDTAALKAFVSGTRSGYITTWYDQSGNGKDLTQSTTSRQPRIVNSGVVERENGLPTIRFISKGEVMYAPAMNIQSVSAVRKAYSSTSSNDMQYLFSVPADYDFSIRSSSSTNWTYGDFNTDDFWTTGGSLYVNNVSSVTYPSTLHTLYSSCASARTSSTFSLSSLVFSESRGMNSGDPVSELIVFPAPLAASERTSLYIDQKSYFTIP